MSTPKSTEPELVSIDSEQLAGVSGGATRASGKSGDSDVTAMLTQIGNSIKDLAAQKTSSGGDTMTLMMMMLMMGGGGGGVAAPAAVSPPVINVDSAVTGGGCRRRGKKGW
ncbi:MAG: hypothetical protein JNL83_26215 [Myxococcales bacterium]|nr:hypothetical protein [Myxococcales bacterium]